MLDLPQVQRLFPNFPHLFHLMSHMELHHATGWPKMEIVTGHRHQKTKSLVHDSQKRLHPRKLTWQWKNHHLKMYLLLKMVTFHCDVSTFREGNSEDMLIPRVWQPKTSEISFMSERNHSLIIGSVVCLPPLPKKKSLPTPKQINHQLHLWFAGFLESLVG